jgi:methyl-accepting chemotaxis protein
MVPFNDFKDIINDTVKMISECSKQIDDVVKQSEQKAKDKKLKQIKDEYETFLDFKELVAFERLYDPKWLNKTVTLKKAIQELTDKITTILDGLNTIDSLAIDDKDLVKQIYLDKLDLGEAIKYANDLAEKQKKLAEQKERERDVFSVVVSRPCPVITEKVAEAEQIKEEIETLVSAPHDMEVEELPDVFFEPKKEVQRVVTVEQKEAEKTEQILVRLMQVKGTAEQLNKLVDFMDNNNICWVRVETNNSSKYLHTNEPYK